MATRGNKNTKHAKFLKKERFLSLDTLTKTKETVFSFPQDLKQLESLNIFKKYIRTWKPESCAKFFNLI